MFRSVKVDHVLHSLVTKYNSIASSNNQSDKFWKDTHMRLWLVQTWRYNLFLVWFPANPP